MFKGIFSALIMLLFTSGVCKASCRYGHRVRPIFINMDEITAKRLNIVYDTEVTDVHHYYVEFSKTRDSKYIGIHTVHGKDNTVVVDMGIVTYIRGILRQSFPRSYDEYEIFTWYILAETDDGSMLVYLCDNEGYSSNDNRLILVPTSKPVFGSNVFTILPSDQVLSEESLKQLLAVDKGYAFKGNLTMIPHAVVDSFRL